MSNLIVDRKRKKERKHWLLPIPFELKCEDLPQKRMWPCYSTFASESGWIPCTTVVVVGQRFMSNVMCEEDTNIRFFWVHKMRAMSSFLTRAATPSMYCEVGDISTSFKGVISINEDILKQQAAALKWGFSLLHVITMTHKSVQYELFLTQIIEKKCLQKMTSRNLGSCQTKSCKGGLQRVSLTSLYQSFNPPPPKKKRGYGA